MAREAEVHLPAGNCVSYKDIDIKVYSKANARNRSIAIAGGGTYRAVDKSYSPSRFLKASFSIKRTMPRPWKDEEELDEIDWDVEPKLKPLRDANYKTGDAGIVGGYHAYNLLMWFA